MLSLAVSTVTSVKEIVRMILEKTGHKETNVRYTQEEKGWPGDVPRVRLSTTKLEKLGWKAKYTSDFIIKVSCFPNQNLDFDG
jgi:nucleoside-diphosphate-sugar epimerase